MPCDSSALSTGSRTAPQIVARHRVPYSRDCGCLRIATALASAPNFAGRGEVLRFVSHLRQQERDRQHIGDAVPNERLLYAAAIAATGARLMSAPAARTQRSRSASLIGKGSAACGSTGVVCSGVWRRSSDRMKSIKLFIGQRPCCDCAASAAAAMVRCQSIFGMTCIIKAKRTERVSVFQTKCLSAAINLRAP